MNNMIFYPAYAYRRPIDHENIIKDKPCSSFEEAYKIARDMLFDDDDAGVLIEIKKQWYKVWYRDDKGILMVSKENEGYRDIQPITNITMNK